MLSDSLKILLSFAKATPSADVSWASVSEALVPAYGLKLGLIEVMECLLNAYEDALNEKRFRLGPANVASRKLLCAPISGINRLRTTSLDTKFSIEQFYDSMVKEIVSEFRIATVDWCGEAT